MGPLNTPAHLVLGAAAFGRPVNSRFIAAALVGGMLPDLSLYVLVGVSVFVLGISPNRVFNELYFSAEWQTVFAIDNSFILWGLLLALCLWKSWQVGKIVCLAALLHIACDFPLHHDDGRPHFWPLTSWVFESSFSYWDRAHGAHWVAPFEAALVTLGAIMVWLRRPPLWAGLSIAGLLIMEYWIVRQWLFFFVDG